MRRQTLFIVLAGLAAALAAIVVYSALKKREAEVARARGESVEIVVAASDLPLGSRVEPGSVKLARWSREAIPPGAFLGPAPLMNSYVRRALVANEPVVTADLFQGEKTAGVMPLLISPGMGVMSVQVDEVSDIAGFACPMRGLTCWWP